MFDKMKQFMHMQKKMQELKRQLDSATFEVLSSDSSVKLVMNGSQELKEVSIQKELAQIEKSRLEAAIKDAYTKALKKSHEIAASKMKETTGFNIPGLM